MSWLPVFPITFHLLCKPWKMCESALKFLQKCHSSGFLTSPFHNANLKKKVITKKRASCHRLGICCDSQGNLKKRSSCHKPAAFCVLRIVTKKMVIAQHQTLCLQSPQNNTGIKCSFTLLKKKNVVIKCYLALVKNL